MNCENIKDRLGAYLDGELAPHDMAAVEDHVASCASCETALTGLRRLIDQLAAADDLETAQAPADAWDQIDQRLTEPLKPALSRGPWAWRLARKPLAAAASLALLVGIATSVSVWLNSTAQTAQAAAVDYSVLLDGLGTDVNAAVQKFLRHYHARPLTAESVRSAAPNLGFRLPAELPGEFRRGQIYSLDFGGIRGVAAEYRRGDEPLFVFFHPPVDQTRLGVHSESHCHVAGREGHRVEVGPWRLVHFTDPTTCHCLLSRLDEPDLTAVLQSVALRFPEDGQAAD
ncbi:MAG: hypothetical protein AMXMBFR13_08900 [Phycisphaerae bacterium]